MDWAFMVVMIVAIVTVGNIVRAKMGIQKDGRGNDYVANDPAVSAEARRLEQEVRTLKDRIAVLERVITDNHSTVSLDREIEKLRDGRN
ncbi:hypothetical protein K9B35_05035 [Sphingomonas sp. R647]|jgi:uncharacterized protein YlxW (UPF0749 family)|uniref:hypothetical protein n=1 Tax=unclassified Sphingomonas TaxID=196159 RepID=UPI0010DD2B86|nr:MULTISPECIES: hypothetical protein [unclassified Sphingomonas]MCA1197321.1 hypothetical protein [Sphingomonas sp. R647]RYD62995.1 MAG: hypothetical protein EOP58_12230 [Sphingomonadales bacterium]HEV7290674.1 hypothetical protein [Sphingomonas sp.]